MNYVVAGVFLLVGLVNFYPVIGVFSVANLSQLYGIEDLTAEIELLLRHRAVLFGLLGAFLVAAAFKPALRFLAALAGLISMISFILIALASRPAGQAIENIVVIDTVASAALVLVLAYLLFSKN